MAHLLECAPLPVPAPAQPPPQEPQLSDSWGQAPGEYTEAVTPAQTFRPPQSLLPPQQTLPAPKPVKWVDDDGDDQLLHERFHNAYSEFAEAAGEAVKNGTEYREFLDKVVDLPDKKPEFYTRSLPQYLIGGIAGLRKFAKSLGVKTKGLYRK